MKTGPTQKTMKKLIAASCDGRIPPVMPVEQAIGYAPSAEPLLTDWIPCTTPPVREGVYQRDIPSHGAQFAHWDGKKWGLWGRNVEEAMEWSTHHSHFEVRWRGVRRWVLVKRRRPDLPDGGLINTYVAGTSGGGSVLWTDDLANAEGFDTQAQALDWRNNRWPFELGGVAAVLP